MISSTVNHATNRKKREGGQKSLILDILDILKKSDKPMATQEIASVLQKPWHSVQTRCLMLQIENKLNGFRVGRINLWQIKS